MQRWNPVWGSHGRPSWAGLEQGDIAFGHTSISILHRDLLIKQDCYSYRGSLLLLNALCDKGRGQGS